MGFRTTLVSEDCQGVKLPKWFIEKWKDSFNFGEHKYDLVTSEYRENTLLLSSKHERKMYMSGEEEIFLDLQKLLVKKNIDKLIIIMLHECGGITRVQIEKDKIRLSEPSKWKEVEEITHDYCYGCSDLK